MPSKHDRTAQRIAKRLGGTYNRGQGPDIKTREQATEVERAETVSDGLRQLKGFQKPVYIAGADAAATRAALEATEGTTVGVRDPNGRILKRSTRKRH